MTSREKVPNRLKETLDVLGDREMMRELRASKRYFGKGGAGLSFDDVFGEQLRAPKKRTRRRSVRVPTTSPAASPPVARRSSPRKAARRR